MIGHKSQSAIITTKILIDIKDTFATSLTYVMLSKITNQANLKIVGILHQMTSPHAISKMIKYCLPHLKKPKFS
jgi:hypothetical protein